MVDRRRYGFQHSSATCWEAALLPLNFTRGAAIQRGGIEGVDDLRLRRWVGFHVRWLCATLGSGARSGSPVAVQDLEMDCYRLLRRRDTELISNELAAALIDLQRRGSIAGCRVGAHQ